MTAALTTIPRNTMPQRQVQEGTAKAPELESILDWFILPLYFNLTVFPCRATGLVYARKEQSITGRVSQIEDEEVCRCPRSSATLSATGLYIPNFCDKESKNFAGGYGIQVGIGRGMPTWGMVAFGEMQPRFENCVSLQPGVRDAWGIPAARIECSHSQGDVNMVAHMKRMLPQIAAAGGLRVDKNLDVGRPNIFFRLLRSRVFTDYGAYWPGGAIHETGGARMGDTPDTSVLNSYCQCWDADNVFVTDGACFVSSGFQNPTLTMMAITARACQFIVHEYA
jgi:choline dehydrogenase-like flavoprotein